MLRQTAVMALMAILLLPTHEAKAADTTPDVLTLQNNIVFYLADSIGEKDPVSVSRVTNMMQALGVPYSGSDGSTAAIVCVTHDYQDPETGATFPAGYYRPHQSGSSRSYFGSGSTGGLKNIKKIIYYFATSYDPQFSTYLVNDGGRYSLDPNNKFVITSPGFKYSPTLILGGKPDVVAAGSYYQIDAPLKFTLDFSDSGTPLDAFDGKLQDIITDTTFVYAMYRRQLDSEGKAIVDDNGKEVPGERIMWSRDNTFQTGYKRPSGILGIAIICGDDNATTRFATVAEQTTTSDACWHDSDPGVRHQALEENEQAAGYYFTKYCSKDMLDYIQAETGYDFHEKHEADYIEGVCNLRQNQVLYTVTDTLSSLTSRNISIALNRLELPCQYYINSTTRATTLITDYTDTATGVSLPRGHYQASYPSTTYSTLWGNSSYPERTGYRYLERMRFYMTQSSAQLKLKVIEVGVDSTKTTLVDDVVYTTDAADPRAITLDLTQLPGWAADKIYLVSYTAPDADSGIMAIAWTTTSAGAATQYADLAEYSKTKVIEWHTAATSPAYYTPLATDGILLPTADATPQSTADLPAYNLAGQRVANGYHGIIIRNGRKMVRYY